MDSLHEQVTQEKNIRARVTELHNGIGFLLDDLEPAALLVDPLSEDCPIVGATRGFSLLSGYTLESLLGSNCRLMLEGVPGTANSKGDRTGIQDFCAMCRVKGLTNAETCVTVLNSRKDGTRFHNLVMLGLCKAGPHTFILRVHISMGEENHCNFSDIADKKEACREAFKLVQAHLIANAPCAAPSAEDCLKGSSCCSPLPDFAFYSERLQYHCLLLHDHFMAVRREPTVVARGCLVFGDQPVQHSPEGLSFTLRVQQGEAFTRRLFSGLPLLGFTKRAPEDKPDLYPFIGHYCGASVMVGAGGQAFARDQFEHYCVSEEPPSIADVQMFSLDPSLPSDLQRAPVQPQSGDELCCRYFRNGHIVLEMNDEIITAFDVERPIDEYANYYAVVDVCFSVYSVLLVPTKEKMAGSAEAASRQISCGSQTSSACPFDRQ